MKKLLLIVLLLTACHSNTIYDDYVKEAKESNISENVPFEVSFYIDKVNDEELIYQVVIDNAKEELNDIKAIVIHNQNTSHKFPSIGIIDDTITLNEEVKGINLIGYVPKKEEIEFKVLVKTNNQKYVVNYKYQQNLPN